MNDITKAYLGKVKCYISISKERILTPDEKIDFRTSLDLILDKFSSQFTAESEKKELSKLYVLRAKILLGMSKIVNFRDACAAHRKCCPYKATNMTKCGANENIEPDGKCLIKDCHYMKEFKEQLRKLNNKD